MMTREMDDFDGILGSVSRISRELEDIKNWVTLQKAKQAAQGTVMGNKLSLDAEDPFEDLLVLIDDGDNDNDKSDERPDDDEDGGDQEDHGVNLDPDQVSINGVSDHEPEPYDDDPEYRPKATTKKKKRKGIVHHVKTHSKRPLPSTLQMTRNSLESLNIPKSVNVEEIIRRKPIIHLGKKFVNDSDDDDDPPPPILIRNDIYEKSSPFDKSNLQIINARSLSGDGSGNEVDYDPNSDNFTSRNNSDDYDDSDSETEVKYISRFSSNGNVMGDSAIVESLISKSDNNKFKNSNDILLKYKSRRVCSFCSKTFKNLRELQNHLSRYHGEPLFKCTICQKAYNQKSNLRIHLRLHTGEKPYGCEYCLKKFSDPSSLYYHKKIHTESRSFKCSMCPKSFTQKGNLKTHIGTHIGNGRKPYACKVCFRRYSNPRYCKRHEENHLKKK